MNTVLPATAQRNGVYYWGGPGTIRMIRLKYFHPRIDEEGLMRSYDEDVLRKLQEKLHLTDAWITYSWGFSPATEKEDADFLRAKLDNFRKTGIKTHAYVQGTNLVYDEHKDKDYFCQDHAGHLIPYHRGRKLCCPVNPHFRAEFLRRVEEACKLGTEGVYIDNFHMGQFPLSLGGFATFFGCACKYCREAFRAFSGHSIPHAHYLDTEPSQAYIEFRCDVMHRLAKDIRDITTAYGKEFGSNSFDQNLHANLYYGYDLEHIRDMQDYLLFENFNHPLSGRSNAHHKPIINRSNKPIFIVSYKSVIGNHKDFTQRDLDAIYSESASVGYMPCYKASEFTTRRTWHNLDADKLREVHPTPLPTVQRSRLSTWCASMPFARRVTAMVNSIDLHFAERMYESRFWRRALGWIADAITVRRLFHKPSLFKQHVFFSKDNLIPPVFHAHGKRSSVGSKAE